MALCWSDVDAQCRTLFILMSKNGDSRTIPFTRAALKILRELPRYDDRVFPISANAIRLAWGRLKKRVCVVDLRFHDLRHVAISRFFEMGVVCAMRLP